MRTEFLLLLLFVSTCYALQQNPFSADPIMKKLAENLMTLVQDSRPSEFVKLFKTRKVADEIRNLARGKLFNDDLVRMSFTVNAIPGSKYIGGLHSLNVFGKLKFTLFDPSQRSLKSHLFSASVRKIDNIWKITALNRIAGNDLQSLPLPRSQRKTF